MLERSPRGRVAGRGLSSSRARFERRAVAARRRPRLIAGLVAALLAVVGLVAWLGWWSSVLTATTVEVRGVPAAAAAEVRSVAAVPLGGPLMRVDTQAVADRLVAGRLWKDVSVGRSLPHTVVVAVTPRVAALAVRTPGGAVDLVDADGFAFRTVSSVPDGLPVVRSGSGSLSAEGVSAALQAMSSLRPELRAEVSDVSVSAADQVSFTLRSTSKRTTVVWGGAGDGALKARLVEVLLEEPGRTIDVSVPDAPVTR
jgi:cell division protein FtsQ